MYSKSTELVGGNNGAWGSVVTMNNKDSRLAGRDYNEKNFGQGSAEKVFGDLNNNNGQFAGSTQNQGQGSGSNYNNAPGSGSRYGG